MKQQGKAVEDKGEHVRVIGDQALRRCEMNPVPSRKVVQERGGWRNAMVTIENGGTLLVRSRKHPLSDACPFMNYEVRIIGANGDRGIVEEPQSCPESERPLGADSWGGDPRSNSVGMNKSRGENDPGLRWKDAC